MAGQPRTGWERKGRFLVRSDSCKRTPGSGGFTNGHPFPTVLEAGSLDRGTGRTILSPPCTDGHLLAASSRGPERSPSPSLPVRTLILSRGPALTTWSPPEGHHPPPPASTLQVRVSPCHFGGSTDIQSIAPPAKKKPHMLNSGTPNLEILECHRAEGKGDPVPLRVAGEAET